VINLDKKPWQWISLLFLSFVWGASFILMKHGLDVFSHVQVAAIRVFVSFLVLLPISIKNLKLINKNNLGILIISGLMGNFFPAFLYTFSQTHISSSLAGVLNGLTPFFVLLVGVIAFKNRPSFLQYMGIIVGFTGTFILITNGNLWSFGSINIYVLPIILATLMYGVNANLIRFKLQKMSGVQIISLTFFFIGPLAGIILLFTDFSAPLQSPDFMFGLLLIALLALFGSVITLFIYYELIHHSGAIFASSSTYIIPFFALMWGIFDGEKVSMIHFYSLLIILAGVYLSSRRKIKGKSTQA
jgi:drug/metabolite transporter (DMT)-like permease